MRDININVQRISIKHSLFLSVFNETFSSDFGKKHSNIKLLQILPVGAELFHADGQKDRLTDTHDKTNCRFSQFCGRV